VKVRVGFGLGIRTSTDRDSLTSLVDGLEARGFDSLWLSERLTGPCPDPIVGLTFAAARTTRLKLGTSVQVLPGRNPVDVAKQWATLDRLSGGRALPAFGLGTADAAEHRAFGVERSARAGLFDEALSKVRALWRGEDVDGVRLTVLPVQQPPDVWLGGRAPSELRRVGRVGDGWLPSFCTAADVEAGRQEIERTAAEHGRTIDEEHFGALVPYVAGDGELPDVVAAAVRARRPDVDPLEVIPVGWSALRTALERFVGAGASKFVVVPVVEPAGWDAELDRLADALLDLHDR
jgi:probable F420-dependent oxidoreductase